MKGIEWRRYRLHKRSTSALPGWDLRPISSRTAISDIRIRDGIRVPSPFWHEYQNPRHPSDPLRLAPPSQKGHQTS